MQLQTAVTVAVYTVTNGGSQEHLIMYSFGNRLWLTCHCGCWDSCNVLESRAL